MGRWLALLAAWYRWPTRGCFAELDVQIDKLRMLRDSYHAPLQAEHASARSGPDRSLFRTPGHATCCGQQ